MFDPYISDIYILHRPHTRNTYITISNEGKVTVRTPLRDELDIRRILEQKRDWINKKLYAFSSMTSIEVNNGENIMFRGEIQKLTQFPTLAEKIAKYGFKQKYYDEFYRAEAEVTLPSRLSFYARKIGLSPSLLRYKRMKSRWGSCKSDGTITLNTLLMQLSYRHIDYVIVHELAHLKHMNHSKEFHALVESILPDQKLLRHELKQIHLG